MQQYLFFIRNEGDCALHMSTEQHAVHVQKVIAYIDNLRASGKLISAQPLTERGVVLGGKGGFKDGPFVESKELIAGYFLFRASSFEEAREIAASHPILVDDPEARIELREIKIEVGIND